MTGPGAYHESAPAPAGSDPAFFEEREAQLRDYLAVLRKHKWVLLAVMAVAMGATALVTFRQVPVYRATSKVNIRRDPPPGAANFQDAWSFLTTQREYMETQYEIMRSRDVARKALEDTGRWGTEDFPAETPTLDTFLGNVEVRPVKDTFLVTLSVVGIDPKQCAIDANAMVFAYERRNEDSKNKTARDKLSKIGPQLEKKLGELSSKEAELVAYRRQKQVRSFDDQRLLINSNLAKLSSTLIDVQSRRRSAEARNKSVLAARSEGGDLNTIPFVANSRVIENYRAQEVRLLEQRFDLAARYKGGHPQVQAVDRKLESVRLQIGKELENIADRITVEFQEMQFQEQDLQQAIEKHRQDLNAIDKSAANLVTMQRDLDRLRAEVDALVEQQSSIQSSTAVTLNNVQVIDRAQPPEDPFRPDPFLNLTLAAVVGLVAGIGLAFLLEHLDDTLTSIDDVERTLGLPVVASIPHVGDDAGHRVVRDGAHGPAAEAFRALRTALVFSRTGRAAKTLLVTSATASEGKTFVVVNLACALAQGGARTLVLDADLRRPRISKAFEMDRVPGLADVLVGRAPLEDAIRATDQERLDVLPAGELPENPSELLGGDALVKLLERLAEKYDRIIIDTPPTQVVTDPCVVAAIADATLPLVSASQVTRTTARRMIESLAQVGARPLGVVLNQVPSGDGGYGYYAYSAYRRPAPAQPES
jgi:capsular exopolysaccharide synthesis family protein